MCPIFVAQSMQLSAKQWEIKELRSHIMEQVIRVLYHRCEFEGATPTGPVVFSEPFFYKRVKVQTHAHGWEMQNINCSEDEAELVQVHAEMTAQR